MSHCDETDMIRLRAMRSGLHRRMLWLLLPLVLLAAMLTSSAVLAATQPAKPNKAAEDAKKEFKDNKEIVQSLAGLVALLTAVVTLLPKALESVTLVSRRRRDLQRIDELTALTHKVQAEGVLSEATSGRIKEAIEAELVMAAEMLERTRTRRSVRAGEQDSHDLSFARRFFLLFQPMCWRGIIAHYLAYACVVGSLAIAYTMGQAWPDPHLELVVKSGSLSTGKDSLQVDNAIIRITSTVKNHDVDGGTLQTSAGPLRVTAGRMDLPEFKPVDEGTTEATGTLQLPEGSLTITQGELRWALDGDSGFRWSEFTDYGGWLMLLIGLGFALMFRAWALGLHQAWRRAHPGRSSEDLELAWFARLGLSFRPAGWRAWLAHGLAYAAALFGLGSVIGAVDTSYQSSEYPVIAVAYLLWLAPFWMWALLERWRSVGRARQAREGSEAQAVA